MFIYRFTHFYYKCYSFIFTPVGLRFLLLSWGKDQSFAFLPFSKDRGNLRVFLHFVFLQKGIQSFERFPLLSFYYIKEHSAIHRLSRAYFWPRHPATKKEPFLLCPFI